MAVKKASAVLKNAVIIQKIVDTSQTATPGYGLVRSTDDDHVDDASTNGNAYCVCVESSQKTSLQVVQVALLTGGAIVPVKVGTGGATCGAYAIHTTDGWTDQTLGGGTGVKYIGGKFLESGSAGDFVGMMVGQFAGGA